MIKIFRATSKLSDGAGIHAVNINNEINKYDEFVSHIIAPREERKLVNKQIDVNKIRPWNISYNYLRTTFLGLDSIFNPCWVKYIDSKINEYDIFHLHHLQGYYFDIRSLKLFRDKKVVITFHDLWPITGRCGFPGECMKWKYECYNCQRKEVYPHSYIDLSNYLFKKKKKLFSSIKNLYVVAISYNSKNKIAESFLKNKPIKVIPPGINTDKFSPTKADANIQNNTINVGVISYKIDSKRKGYSDLLQIFDYVKNKKLGYKFKFTIMGHIGSENMKKLKHYDFVGFKEFSKDYKNIINFYNYIDILLNLSKEETFGKTNIEAQACGTPVLARDLDVFNENILFGEMLRSVSPENIINKLKNIYLKKFNKENMHKEISKKYSLNSIGKRYNELYQCVLNS